MYKNAFFEVIFSFAKLKTLLDKRVVISAKISTSDKF